MPRRRSVRKAIEKKLNRAWKLGVDAERRLVRATLLLAEIEARFSRLTRRV